MKILKSILLLNLFMVATAWAQHTETGILTNEIGELEKFTEWKKVTVVENSQEYSYEYRIALVKRKGIGCHYTIEVKNTSAVKIKVNINTNYYDKLVKGYFGEEVDAKIKPSATEAFLIIAQGCKADKDKKDMSDYELCSACDFSYLIKTEID